MKKNVLLPIRGKFIIIIIIILIANATSSIFNENIILKLLKWVENHSAPGGYGVYISNKKKSVYPEVTGYYIPTLLENGRFDLAMKYSKFLIEAQDENGAFGLPGESFAFDTGMVVRGWLAMYPKIEKGTAFEQTLVNSLKKSCTWLSNHIDPVTKRFYIPQAQWGLYDRGYVTEGIHLLVVKPLLDCGVLLNDNGIIFAAKQVKQSFLKEETIKKLGLLNFEQRHMLTHFFAYIMEALVELDRIDLVKIGMNSVAKYQDINGDGGVPGYFDVEWVCTTGLSQLSMVWYRIGEIKRGDMALSKVIMDLQNKDSGGFFGSVGFGASYFPDQEISWAVKYTLDALQTVTRAHFDKTYEIYPMKLRADDGRLKVIIQSIEKFLLDGQKKMLATSTLNILDVGAGKGRFAKAIKELYPSNNIHVYATDLSEKMLSFVPKYIHTAQATVTSLPFQSNMFDVIFAVEVLEHVPIYEQAIVEMKRVLKPGGRIVIIDKDANDPRSKIWELDPWEQWFNNEDMLQTLRRNQFIDVESMNIGYEHVIVPDGLFLAWIGRKPPDVSMNDVNMKKKIIFVVIGTRPEAIKLAPVVHSIRAANRQDIVVKVCATGQHQELLYETLNFVGVEADIHLNAMKSNQSLASLHGTLLTSISNELELLVTSADTETSNNVALVIVQGDTMSALAGAEAAFYHQIPVAHVEAGLRTHLKYSPFPEELNRKTISSLASLHFAVSELGVENLMKENINKNIEVVGNTVIDQIHASLKLNLDPQTLRNLKELFPNTYNVAGTHRDGSDVKKIILVTLHRRENHGSNLKVICNGLMQLALIQHLNIRIMFVLHPNPNVQRPIIDMLGSVDGITLIKPLPYLTLIHVLSRVNVVFTDSGGLQEEGIALGKKVLVLRESTDRPEGNPIILKTFTLSHFLNVGVKMILSNQKEKSAAEKKQMVCNVSDPSADFCTKTPYGDGKASKRIRKRIFEYLDDESKNYEHKK